MLVLTRKVGERIHIGDSIVLTIVRIQTDQVRVGIDAPRQVVVHREEVARRLGMNRFTPARDAVKPPITPDPAKG